MKSKEELSLKMKFEKLNPYLKYTFVFFLILLIGLLPIEIKNRSFLFSGLFVDRKAGIDGLKQHLIFMRDYIKYIKSGLFNGGISFYRFDIGLGSDFINHYTYYSLFDPLLIIAYLIPLKYIEFSYYLLIILRLYLSGIAIIILVKKLGIKDEKAHLSIGIFYSFSAAILFSAFRHPMFVNGPMYVPLILYGYEKIKRKESEIPLIISVFFALISQFYIFIYTTFAFILWTFIELVKEKNYKLYLKVNLYYLLGVLLGGFVLTTQMMATLNGARVGTKGFKLYDLIDYAVIIITNFLPVAGDHYTVGVGSFFAFFPNIYYLFEKRKTTDSIFFLILCILSISATFSYLINVTSYIVNRWMFLLCVPSAIATARFIEERNYNKKSINNTLKFIFFIFMLGINLLLFDLIINLDSLIYVIFLSLALIILNIITYLLVAKIKIIGIKLANIISSPVIYKYLIYNSAFVLFIFSIIYCFILTPNNVLKTYYGDSNLIKDALNDNGFYRIEKTSFIAGVEDYSNDGVYYNYASTSSYNTMTIGSIIELLEEYNIENNNNSVGYNGFNLRSRHLTTSNVKYLLVRESDKKRIPYGFKYLKSIKVVKYDEEKKIYHQGGNILKDDKGNVVYENLDIYINDLFLNFGVIYDSYLSYTDVSNLHALEKENLLTKTVIIDEDNSQINKYEKKDSIKRENVCEYKLENIEVKDGLFYVKEKGKITFVISEVTNSEVYVEIRKIENLDREKSFNTKYVSRNSEWIVKNYAYASNMYIENKNHLINLGYFEDEKDLIIEIHLDEGIYQIEDISYYLLSSTGLEADIKKLNNNSLTELEFGKNILKGKINTKVSGYMLLAIPYSKGFKAYLDGKETKIYKANYGYMAVFVDSNAKTFELQYQTPGLEIGTFISISSFLVFVLILRNRILNKKQEEEDINEIYN